MVVATADAADHAAAAAAPIAPAAPHEDPALLRLADRTAQHMAALRQLPILRPIQRGVLDRAQILTRLRERVSQEYPPGEVELEAEILRRLGLIPESMDYEATVFALLEEQVAGFYDPDAQRLYVASWVPSEMQAGTLSHEVVHALQDQHFGIARYTHHARGQGDAQTAAMAVVEGDATLAMTENVIAPLGRSVRDLADPDALFRQQMTDLTGQPRLAAAPRALRETLVFPYRYGFNLCARRYRSGGFASIDELLRTPPASTEQVLHPEKLESREPPIVIAATVPEPLAADHVLAYDDVLGELTLRLFLQLFAPDADAANEGAAGWGGDHALLLVPRASGIVVQRGDGGTTLPPGALASAVLVWTIEFDRAAGPREDAEAIAFEAMAAQGLVRRYPSAPVRAIGGAMRAVESAAGRVSLVARSRRRVVIVDRAPADRAAAIVRAVLAPATPNAVPPRAQQP